MKKACKTALITFTILFLGNILLSESSTAQTTSQPSATEFSLNYQAENNTIVITIKNPSGADAYNFRWKEHDSQTWYYSPFHTHTSSPPYFEGDTYGVPSQASSSGSTELALSFIPKTQMGKQLDIQVQALYGTYKAVPYGHAMVLPGGPTYDFSFDGQVSAWSGTKTVTYGEATTAPSPTVPEFPVMTLLPLCIVIPLLATILIKRYGTKNASQYYKKP